MTQLVTRLDDHLVREVDALIADGVVASRSEAVRVGLRQLIEMHGRRQVGNQIADAYRRRPQTEAELAGLDAATRALVEAEPW